MMKRIRQQPLSLTSRVMIFVALTISLSLLLTGKLLQDAVEHHFAEQDADELIVIIHAVKDTLNRADNNHTVLPDSLSISGCKIKAVHSSTKPLAQTFRTRQKPLHQ